jgi:hypothetical protein
VEVQVAQAEVEVVLVALDLVQAIAPDMVVMGTDLEEWELLEVLLLGEYVVYFVVEVFVFIVVKLVDLQQLFKESGKDGVEIMTH